MKYCEKCRVKVESPVEHCPLCYASLTHSEGEPEPPAYPDFTGDVAGYNILLRILLFSSLTVGSVCFVVNVLTNWEVWWSLIVIGNILYMWAAIGTAVRRRLKIGFNIFVQALCLAALMVLLDYFTGYQHWAMNFVVPFLFISATLSISVVAIIKRAAIRDIILYFILTALLGFIPVALMGLGLVTVLWPSLVSAVYSALSLVSLFVFADRATKAELRRRFHV